VRADEYFASEWPLELPRLRRLLSSQGVGYDEIDDVIQETALRLFAAWGRVFEDVPVRPLVTTIALNVARDLHRREQSRPYCVPALPDVLDDRPSVDRTALARIDVARTAQAMASMSVARRRVLAQAVTDELAGEERGRHRAPAAFRMALTRARRELVTAVELAGSVVAVGALIARRASRSPLSHAAALAAAGTGVFVAVALASTPSNGSPDSLTSASASAQPAHAVSSAVTAGTGVSSWSGTPLLGAVGTTSLYQGLSQWVAPGLGGPAWQPGSGPASSPPSACVEHLLVTTIEYPCLPIV
jgi:DNA-directed RNA polymerase specialized sigma24 family protein